MNKRAFTIVELLAVITVLSIILIIAVPKVMGAIEESKKKALVQSAESMVRKVNEAKLLEEVTDKVYTIENGVFVGDSLKISGKLPDSGTIEVDEGGRVSLSLISDKYCVLKEKTNEKIEVIPYYGECVIPTNTSCFLYSSNSNEITITGYSDTCPKDIVIPSVIDSKLVTSIANSAFAQKSLTSVVIPNTITNMGTGAFFQNNIISAKLSENLSTISASSFSGNKLSSIVIPDKVKLIEYSAFSHNQLTNIIIPNNVTTIQTMAFQVNKLTSLTFPTSVTSIGHYSFARNKLTSITIPTSVTDIGGGAFNDNLLPDSNAIIYGKKSDGSDDLLTIVSYAGATRGVLTIPNGVTKIKEDAYSSLGITGISIPNTVTEIGNWAFAYNSSISSLNIPNSVKTIGDYAFLYCNVSNLIIPNNVISIGNSAFRYCKISNLTNSSNVASIGSYAFANNSLTSVNIPTTISQLKQGVFANNKITSINIPSNITSISTMAFNNNLLPQNQAFIYARKSDGTDDLTKIVSYGGAEKSNIIIPNGVTTLGTYSFSNNGITSVMFPSTLKSIDYGAFSNNGSEIPNQLVSVIIPSNVNVLNNSISANFYISYVNNNARADGTYTAQYQDSIWTKQP